MRYPASEKAEIIELVEQSHLSAKRMLDKLGIPRATFYRWYDRYREGGLEALADHRSRPDRVWNRIPDDVRGQIINLARRDPTIAVTAIFGGKSDNGSGERILVGTNRGNITLRSPRLADDPAGMAFRELILALDRFDCLPAPVRRYKFPSATSFRICFSRDRSATSRLSRAFSRSSSLKLLACSISRPPYSLRHR